MRNFPKKQLNIICNSFLELDLKNIASKGDIRVLLFSNDFSKYSENKMKTFINSLVLFGSIEINFVGCGSNLFKNNEKIQSISSVYTADEEDYVWAIASFVQDSYQKKNKNTCDFIIYDDEKLISYFLKNHYSWPMITIN